jgi:hypothetical protein
MFDAPVKSLHYGEKMPLLKNLCGFAREKTKGIQSDNIRL